MRDVRALLLLTAVSGCAGLVGLPDLTYEDPPDGGNDAATRMDGSVDATGPSLDATPADASAADAADSGPGCSPDLSADRDNCGRCGHSCGGGDCESGKCQPLLIEDGVPYPHSVAVDLEYVYYAYGNDADGSGAVKRAPKTPKTPGTPPGSVTLFDAHAQVTGVHVIGGKLFFTPSDGLHACNTDGDAATCAATDALIASAYHARQVTSADGHVYFTSNEAVTHVRPDGGERFDLAAGVTDPWGIATNGRYVYYTSNTNTLERVPVDAGTIEDVGELREKNIESFVTADNLGFFWAYIDPSTGVGHVQGALDKTPASKTPYPSSGSPGTAVGIAIDANFVYWSDAGDSGDAGVPGNGRLLMCPRSGCAETGPVVLATGLRGAGQIALDESAIYFLENDNYGVNGRVRKVAKP